MYLFEISSHPRQYNFTITCGSPAPLSNIFLTPYDLSHFRLVKFYVIYESCTQLEFFFSILPSATKLQEWISLLEHKTQFSMCSANSKGLFTVNAFLSRVLVAVSSDTKGHIVFQCSLSQWTQLLLHYHFVTWVKCSRPLSLMEFF